MKDVHMSGRVVASDGARILDVSIQTKKILVQYNNISNTRRDKCFNTNKVIKNYLL